MEQNCFYAKNVLNILIFLNEGSTFLVLNICHIVSYSEYENNEKNVFKIYQLNQNGDIYMYLIKQGTHRLQSFGVFYSRVHNTKLNDICSL